MDDSAPDDHRFETSFGRLTEAIRATRSATGDANSRLQQWVHERGRLTQIVMGATFSVIAGRLVNAFEKLLTTVSSHAFSLSETQLLVLVVGVIAGQTLIQARKFNQLGNIYRTMSDPPASRADGGEHVPSEERAERLGPLGNGTTGGGLVGGAIAGAGVGSSWGPGGVVGGAIFGAVLGDVFESLANVD